MNFSLSFENYSVIFIGISYEIKFDFNKGRVFFVKVFEFRIKKNERKFRFV